MLPGIPLPSCRARHQHHPPPTHTHITPPHLPPTVATCFSSGAHWQPASRWSALLGRLRDAARPTPPAMRACCAGTITSTHCERWRWAGRRVPERVGRRRNGGGVMLRLSHAADPALPPRSRPAATRAWSGQPSGLRQKAQGPTWAGCPSCGAPHCGTLAPGPRVPLQAWCHRAQPSMQCLQTGRARCGRSLQPMRRARTWRRHW